MMIETHIASFLSLYVLDIQAVHLFVGLCEDVVVREERARKRRRKEHVRAGYFLSLGRGKRGAAGTKCVPPEKYFRLLYR